MSAKELESGSVIIFPLMANRISLFISDTANCGRPYSSLPMDSKTGRKPNRCSLCFENKNIHTCFQLGPTMSPTTFSIGEYFVYRKRSERFPRGAGRRGENGT